MHLACPPDTLVELTRLNPFERFPDGRPRVPDDIVERMKLVTTEEAWGVLRQHGYHQQGLQLSAGGQGVSPPSEPAGKQRSGQGLADAHQPEGMHTLHANANGQIGCSPKEAYASQGQVSR